MSCEHRQNERAIKMNTDPGPLAEATLVRGYLDAKQVLNDATRFSQASKRESAEFVGDTVLTLDGEEHFGRRRLLSRLMRHRVLVHFEETVILPTVHEILARELQDADRLELVRFGRLVFLQLAASMIGVPIPHDRTGHVLERHLYPLIEAVTVEWSQRSHSEVLGDGRTAMRDYVSQLVQPAIEERRRALAAGSAPDDLPPDLLSLMVVEGFADATIHREAVLFLVASTLNNAATLTHAIDETDRWLRSRPAGVEGAGDGIVSSIVHETLRYCVVTPAVFRHCDADTTLPSGAALRHGELVAVLLPDANRDERVWGHDAGVFDPQRSVPAGEKPYGLAFGAGVHACLGRPLVLGTYSEDLTAGMLGRILHELLRRGARVDRDATVELAASDQRRFERFEVRFEHAGSLGESLGIM